MKNFIPAFIQNRYHENKTHGHFPAYAMFVDLSGFTNLTQTLMKEGNEGAEKLSSILNDIFEPMVQLVYERNGFIPYYAGDAFTGIFPEETINIEAFLDTARRLRELTNDDEVKFHGFRIKLKIGLALGNVEWGIVGDEHKSFYFRGNAIDNSAEAQSNAQSQQIVVDAAIHEKAAHLISLKSCSNTNSYLWKNPEEYKDIQVEKVTQDFNIDIQVLKKFLPNSVIKFNQKGEFREVISIFISFKGVKSHEQFNEFTTIVLEELYSFSGYFKEVDFGDKGGVMVMFFGAPVSFENNVERALEFITALKEKTEKLVKETSLKFRVGITSGIAFTGIIGSKERSQYAAVGTNVNLAARFMSYANWSEIMTGEEIRKSRYFRFKDKGAISYKGFEHPVSTYLLKGRNTISRPSYEGMMIGRAEELATLLQLAEKALITEHPTIAYLFGEAGVGKSRLSHELRKSLKKQRNVLWLTCPADQILRKPFNPFITFFRNYFHQSTENTSEENTKHFDTALAHLKEDTLKIEGEQGEKLKKNLSRNKAVLASLVGHSVKSDFWDKLDARGRFQNTLAAISDFFLTQAHSAPLVIELEDGHWYDEYSKTFLQEFVGKIEGLPIFILIPSRYADDGTKPYLIDFEILKVNDLNRHEFDLNLLNANGIKAFTEKKLDGKISTDFFELLQRATNGNPFYLEQVIEYFTESNQLIKENKQWTITDKNVKISGSINAILTARIDRLSRLVKETVKAAAVIGREFELPILQEVLTTNAAFKERNGDTSKVLKEQIESAERGQIWRAMNELRYIFKHSLLREAVYSMQLRTQLRDLHAHIAQAIEKLYQDNLQDHYIDLAFHYEQAEILEKAKFYYKKAAVRARQYFQNERALVYFDKLLDILDPKTEQEKIIKALIKKGSILELIGQWEKCEEIYEKTLQLTYDYKDDLLIGRVEDSLGHLLMLKGDYDAATAHLQLSANALEKINDERGLSKVYGHLGNLNFRQGKYEEAKSYFTRSIALSRLYEHTSVHAQIVANLGLTFMNQGKHNEGIRWQRDQLEICEKNGDKQGMATLYTNMGIVLLEKGDYNQALDCFQNGLKLCEELGNKQLTSIAMGCMGSVYQRKGDYEHAMKLFREDLKITEELGDKQGISIALGLIGNLLNIQGKFEEAKDFLEKNLALTTELGYQKGMAKAVNTLGDIYYNQGKYKEAIDCYDQAINIARSINHALILGESLLEKAEALLADKQLEAAQKSIDEAQNIARVSNNHDLMFGSEILSAQLLFQKNDNAQASSLLESLLDEELRRYEKAAIHYELHKIFPSKTHRNEALTLYQALYDETPQHLFQERIMELGNEEI